MSRARAKIRAAEFDGAAGWRDLGYTSLISFLHRELGLSKGAAFYRATTPASIRGPGTESAAAGTASGV